ncbi:arabinosyltransferase domain-containing protein [Modestobacter excelsi]|uniref:arabinosyltransferase domain-containing protein n=1 Tax=Modestobacter excelsi TaxID=2213161 RepID=UPI00110CA61C|nr:arabinosyltransferase domain-containing protein [Modestobacter excelsi]
MFQDSQPSVPAPRVRRAVLALALVSLVSSVLYVVAPVQRPEAVYAWPSTAGDASAVAIPLMLYRPERLEASVSCTDARASSDAGHVLVSTTPVDAAPGPGLPDGLTVRSTDGRLQVDVGGTSLDPVPVPADGDCSWTLVSTVTGTALSRDGRVLQQVDGDVRPGVAGVFSELDSTRGSRVAVTADTVFQTSPTGWKYTLGVLAVVSLLAAIVLAARADRRRPASADPGRPVRARARWVVDVLVALVLAGWTAIGPLTIDDGYISGIIRSREGNGYVSDVYRWLGAPEAPFGWFYEVLGLWTRISDSTLWLRVPSALLGLAAWLVLGRAVLPRLGAAGAGLRRYVLAAVVFGAWWLPFGLGVRPEAWVVVGLAVSLVLVERALERRAVAPLAVGLVVAGATLAVTPTGAVAFLPFVAAVVPLLRLCRERRDLGWWALLALAAAGAATTVLFMFGDQSLAAIRLANRIRTDLPGSLPWYQEYERYSLLLTAGDVQGPISRRVPVLLTLLATAGIRWQLRRVAADVRPFVLRLLTGLGLSLVVLLFTPTKWTLHFGAFAVTGTAVLLVDLELFSRRGLADRDDLAGSVPGAPVRSVPVGWVRTWGTATTAVAMVAALSYAGYNQWAYLSDLAIPWNDLSPRLLGITASGAALALAVVAGLGTAALCVAAALRDETEVRLRVVRLLPSPAAIAVLVLAATVALELLSFAKSSYERRDTYSLASDTAETLTGEPCGLAERLSVETDPVAGLLAPAVGVVGDTPVTDGFAEVEGGELVMAGVDLPGWTASDAHRDGAGDGPARLVTGWYPLTEPLRTGAVPLTVTVDGPLSVGTRLVAEFGRQSGADVETLGEIGFSDPEGGLGTRDVRLDVRAAGADADLVRLVAEDGGTDSAEPLAVSAPRAPGTTPFSDVVPATEPALVDWPVAFVFPCQRLSVQAQGTTDVPTWRIAAAYPNHAGDIIVAAAVGGPYAPAAQLVDQVVYPVYQDGVPLERPITLLRWVPREALAQPEVTVEDRTVAGWAS